MLFCSVLISSTTPSPPYAHYKTEGIIKGTGKGQQRNGCKRQLYSSQACQVLKSNNAYSLEKGDLSLIRRDCERLKNRIPLKWHYFLHMEFKYSDGNLVKVKHITYLGFTKRKPIPKNSEYLRIVWTTQKRGQRNVKHFWTLFKKPTHTSMSKNQLNCSKLEWICKKLSR